MKIRKVLNSFVAVVNCTLVFAGILFLLGSVGAVSQGSISIAQGCLQGLLSILLIVIALILAIVKAIYLADN